MKIASIQAFPIRSDLARAANPAEARRPSWLADAAVASPMDAYARYRGRRDSWRPDWPAVGCIVRTDSGEWGFGISRYGAPVIALIHDHIGRRLIGEPALATERLWDMMCRLASPYGLPGLAAYAVSAVDLALWDLKGKILKRPVYELLGGPVRESIRCYATGNDTDWHMELGFRATKLACPHGAADGLDGMARNEELVARTRELIGADVELMLDCWMSFDVDYAVRLAHRLRPYRLRWIEDCLPAEDADAHVALRQRLPWQSLASGEHWYGLSPFAAAAARRSVDIFQPDIGWAGGLTACLKICHIAEASGIPVILHAGMNTPYGQHLALAATNMPIGELFIGSAPGQPLADASLFPGMAVPKGGWLVPSGEPGFGLALSLEDLQAMKLSA